MASFLQGLVMLFAGSLHVNIIDGAGSGPRPCVVYLHGGGWSAGSYLNVPPTYTDVINNGFSIISVEYTPSNVSQFPQQIYDIKGAIRWIRSNASALNIDPNRIGIAGESAGAHLAMLVAYTNNVSGYEGSVGGNTTFSSAVNCVVSYSGPTYIPTIMSDFSVKPLIDWTLPRSGLSLLIGGFPKEDVLSNSKIIAASPITHIYAGDVPTMIVHASKDAIVPVEQATRLADRLFLHNVPRTVMIIDGDNHGWQMPTVVDVARTKFLLSNL